MTLGGIFISAKPIEQLLAGHIKFLSQFMYTHARHMVSSSTYPHRERLTQLLGDTLATFSSTSF